MIVKSSRGRGLTDLDEVGGVAEGELEGAVAAGEAERAGLVVTLEVVVSRQHPAQPRHHRHQPACREGVRCVVTCI